MDIYLVVGNLNTRKSSLVRSLTGCFNRSVRDIQPLSDGTPLRLYARAAALQVSGTSPEEAIAEVAARRCEAALLALWASAHPHDEARLPDAATYLKAFEAAGWRLRAAAVLGQNSGGLRGPAVRQFAQAGTQPVNLTAHAVRAHFGWL